MKSKKIAIVVPTLGMGGMERVACEIANYFTSEKQCEVLIINSADKPHFYQILPEIKITAPKKTVSNKVIKLLRNIFFTRKQISQFQPDAVLSFGNLWNTFTLISCIGLEVPVYISDRSNPYRNSSFDFKKNEMGITGKIQTLLRWIVYRRAEGIIAQTELSKQVDQKFLNHSNIKVIGNPIREFEIKDRHRENIILNVGRFSRFKNQIFLIEAFKKINNPNWKIYFAGDGPLEENAVNKVKDLGLENQIKFLGKVKDVDELYAKSKIFAFTSLSEGFPNALAEALSAPVASIAFDCPAGPADLIEDKKNGFLIPMNEKKIFTDRLQVLMEDEEMRNTFEENSRIKMKNFHFKVVGEKYYDFILKGKT